MTIDVANAARRLRLTWPALNTGAPVDAPVETSQGVFCIANIDDPETCDAVQALAPGESVTLGGGANPVVIVTVLR